MTYKIQLKKTPETKVEINVDIPQFSIPPSVSLGVGNKARRYKDHLDHCLSNDQELLRNLAYIHKQGKEHGDVVLFCNCKLKAIHAISIKEWIEENKDTLDMMIPYIFSNEGYTMKKVNLEDLTEEERRDLQGQSSAVLPEADMLAIQALIKEDQERTAQSLNQSKSVE